MAGLGNDDFSSLVNPLTNPPMVPLEKKCTCWFVFSIFKLFTMPFFEINSKKFFFAHVPKCGGTSVEKGLLKIGVDLCFYDPKFFAAANRWNRSSPQHIANVDLERLISKNSFDSFFTVVRDPVARFLSAFNHNRGVNAFFGKKIPWHESVDKFLARLETRSDYFGYRFDNHFVPADFLVPKESKVFYLEDGLEPLTTWLCETSGLPPSKIEFRHDNKKKYNVGYSPSRVKSFVKKKIQPKVPVRKHLSSELEERIRELYKVDYGRFYPHLSILL